MGAVSLGKNITALKLQRQLSLSTQEVSSSYSKLSSGLRITNPSDDAAGAALAAGLKLDTRVFAQSIRNLNDGVSAINVAEGSLRVASQIITRVKELATQAANGILSSSQRQALDTEADALIDEYNRILNATEFNGRKLLDGTDPNISLQAGFGADDAIAISIGSGGSGTSSTVGDGTLGSVSSRSSTHFQEGGKYSIGDINGDGYGDLVSLGPLSLDKIFVYLGNGNGTFATAISYAAGNEPTAVALADVNGDNHLDIIETARIDGTMNILINNGNGTFAARVSYADTTSAYDVEVMDIDGDGDKDVVTGRYTNGSGNIGVFLNNGNGTFAAKVSYSGGNSVYNITLADVNGDNRADIITAAAGDGRVNVLFNNGNGTFAALTSYSSGTSTFDVSAADLDGDGDNDLVSASSFDDKVRVYFNNGNGTFTAGVSYSGGDTNSRVFLADMNGDGRADIITFNSTAGVAADVMILTNNGNGTFGAPVSYATGFGNGVAQLGVGDLNNDGVTDVVAQGIIDTSYGAFLTNTTTTTTSSTSLALEHYDLTTSTAAQTALTDIDTALDNVSSELGRLGSYQTRLGSALRTLAQRNTESQVATARITDVDVASEVSKMLKAEIRQNAATALLAQANQNGSYALELLGVGG